MLPVNCFVHLLTFFKFRRNFGISFRRKKFLTINMHYFVYNVVGDSIYDLRLGQYKEFRIYYQIIIIHLLWGTYVQNWHCQIYVATVTYQNSLDVHRTMHVHSPSLHSSMSVGNLSAHDAFYSVSLLTASDVGHSSIFYLSTTLYQ